MSEVHGNDQAQTPDATGNTSVTVPLLTQDEVNRLVGKARQEGRQAAQNELTAKYGNLDELLKLKQEVEAKRAAEMTELEKAQQRLAALEAEREREAQRAKEAELKALRLEVGQQKGLPPTLAQRLSGSTREELEADADLVLSDLKQAARPIAPNLDATAGGASERSAIRLTPEQEAIISRTPGMTREKYIEALKKQG